jgi:integral membrane protein
MNQIKILRYVAVSEGISFLVLLLVAMPLKYYFGIPDPVKWVGWAHGVLFMAYVALVFLSWNLMRWNFISLALALAASLVPLGPFLLDGQLKRREQEISSQEKL